MAMVSSVGCGGGSKTPAQDTNTQVTAPDDAEDETEAAEVEPEPVAPPKTWRAQAALTPTKGTKLKPSIVSFVQQEGEATMVELDTLDGLKPGTYLLVVHDGSACGPNATKAGRIWPGVADQALRVVVEKDLTSELQNDRIKAAVDGEAGITGRPLVLHEDKKGKPGKALACGVIEAAGEDS